MLKEGIYEQVINEELKKKLKDLNIEQFLIEKENMDVEEAKTVLSAYISSVIKKALRFIRENNKKDDKEALLSQIKACNELIKALSRLAEEDNLQGFKIAEEGEILTALYSKINSIKGIKEDKALRPVTPLSQSSLFTGFSQEPNMMSEIKTEILCCDAIDYKAIEELSKLKNTEIKISCDTERTRLHAKAYLFKRKTGFTTAYIGSSNMSNAALTSGIDTVQMSRYLLTD